MARNAALAYRPYDFDISKEVAEDESSALSEAAKEYMKEKAKAEAAKKPKRST